MVDKKEKSEEPKEFSSKDERDFRPASIKELYAHQKYEPWLAVYTKSDGSKIDLNWGCWLTCQDVAIIISCFITLWSILLGLYVLLLKAALDTDEKCVSFVSLVISVQVERPLDLLYVRCHLRHHGLWGGVHERR